MHGYHIQCLLQIKREILFCVICTRKCEADIFFFLLSPKILFQHEKVWTRDCFQYLQESLRPRSKKGSNIQQTLSQQRNIWASNQLLYVSHFKVDRQTLSLYVPEFAFFLPTRTFSVCPSVFFCLYLYIWEKLIRYGFTRMIVLISKTEIFVLFWQDIVQLLE